LFEDKNFQFSTNALFYKANALLSPWHFQRLLTFIDAIHKKAPQQQRVGWSQIKSKKFSSTKWSFLLTKKCIPTTRQRGHSLQLFFVSNWMWKEFGQKCGASAILSSVQWSIVVWNGDSNHSDDRYFSFNCLPRYKFPLNFLYQTSFISLTIQPLNWNKIPPTLNFNWTTVISRIIEKEYLREFLDIMFILRTVAVSVLSTWNVFWGHRI
jgi:hypothetical protein